MSPLLSLNLFISDIVETNKSFHPKSTDDHDIKMLNS